MAKTVTMSKILNRKIPFNERFSSNPYFSNLRRFHSGCSAFCEFVAPPELPLPSKALRTLVVGVSNVAAAACSDIMGVRPDVTGVRPVGTFNAFIGSNWKIFDGVWIGTPGLSMSPVPKCNVFGRLTADADVVQLPESIDDVAVVEVEYLDALPAELNGGSDFPSISKTSASDFTAWGKNCFKPGPVVTVIPAGWWFGANFFAGGGFRQLAATWPRRRHAGSCVFKTNSSSSFSLANCSISRSRAVCVSWSRATC